MWYLAIFTILNGILHNERMILEHRLYIGSVPINILDGFLFAGIVFGLMKSRFRPGRIPAIQTHPLLIWIIGLFTASLLGGIVGFLINNIDTTYAATALRNQIALPMAICIGYLFISNEKDCKRFGILYIITGVWVAALTLIHFSELAHEANVQRYGINAVRSMHGYNYRYAGIAAAYLIFVVIIGYKKLPSWFLLSLAGFCILGQCATLSRSDWIALAFGIFVIYFLIPRHERINKAFTMAFSAFILVAIIWVGLFAASQITNSNFFEKMNNRVFSLLPGYDVYYDDDAKAWETRVPGIIAELSLWIRNPVSGQGYGIQENTMSRHGRVVGMRHNSWTSALAETGLIGFAACVLAVFAGPVVIGLRIVRTGVDYRFVLLGGMGVTAGAYFCLHGLATMSFNQERGAIVIGIITGAVIRCREMQLSVLQQQLACDTAENIFADSPLLNQTNPPYTTPDESQI